MATYLDIPTDRADRVVVVDKRRRAVELPARMKLTVLKTDRVLIVGRGHGPLSYRLPIAGLLCRTDAWLRLRPTPLAQPAGLRN